MFQAEERLTSTGSNKENCKSWRGERERERERENERHNKVDS